MITPTLNMTYGGKPMEVLNRLLEAREKWLYEGYKDATVATAITALTSIRAATKPWEGKIGMGFFCTVTRRDDVHPAFCGHRRCIREGRFRRKGAPRVDLGRNCVQLVPPGDMMWPQASVFRVEITDEQHERWPKQPVLFYVVAMSEAAVKSYLERRFKNIANRQSGLAKTVLGVAMAKLSTRPAANEKAGAHVHAIAEKYGVVAQSDSGDRFSVRVESNLSYAVDAVKGGQAGVADALKRSANRIAGMINHKVGLPLEEKLTTPFPEVKRR